MDRLFVLYVYCSSKAQAGSFWVIIVCSTGLCHRGQKQFQSVIANNVPPYNACKITQIQPEYQARHWSCNTILLALIIVGHRKKKKNIAFHHQIKTCTMLQCASHCSIIPLSIATRKIVLGNKSQSVDTRQVPHLSAISYPCQPYRQHRSLTQTMLVNRMWYFL